MGRVGKTWFWARSGSGAPQQGVVSLWVISIFNSSVFYEQGVNQEPAPTASCKGLINWRFMGQQQRKAVEVENGPRPGSQGEQLALGFS